VPGPLGNQSGVAGEVADAHVELGECDPKLWHVLSVCAGVC
jgi:hypothetical protein